MILLRKSTDSDLPLIMAWRSNPLIFSGFFSQKSPLSWGEHHNWWASRNADWHEFIIELFECDILRPIGVVSIGQLDHWSPEIGYFIGNPTDWGKGYGKQAVEFACKWLKKSGKEYAHTTILDNNERSIRLVKSLGFEYLGKAREGESWYQKKL